MDDRNEIIWSQFINEINKSDQKDTTLITNYLEDAFLYEFNKSEIIIATNQFVNSLILKSYEDFFESIFNKIYNLNAKCRVYSIDDLEKQQKSLIEDIIAKELSDNLNSEFTFNNFVVGPCNFKAHTAAFNCARNPGKKETNPLIIYGDSGLGKTHLLNAIGNYIKENNTDKSVLYISSMSFVNEVVKAINEKRIDEYKSQLNSVDVLLFDDIQLLSGKTVSCNIFFDVYNDLYNKQKQIILTSDRPSSEIKDIENRLKSRFSQGLSVTISSLEEETAYKILELKIKNHNIDRKEISPEVISYMAKNYSKDVRSLEGALNTLLFYIIQFKSDSNVIDLKMALEAFEDEVALNKDNNPLDVKKILTSVADYYHLNRTQLLSKNRTKNIATARHISMYLCRKHLDLSYNEIGKEFGGKDHTTVASACDKIDSLVKKEEIYRKIISDIENSF